MNLNNLKEYARGGNIEAMYKLASVYQNGEGVVEKNYTQAVKWYRTAADKGHAKSQFALAEFYHNKEGLNFVNFSEAFKWYQKAALQGHKEAKHELAWMRMVKFIKKDSKRIKREIEKDDASFKSAMLWLGSAFAAVAGGMVYVLIAM